MLNLWELVFKGGWFMVPLLASSIVGIGVVIERFRYLSEVAVDNEGLRKKVAALVQAGRLRQAIQLVESTPGPVAAIFDAALRKLQFLVGLGKEPDQVEEGVIKSMEDHAIHVVADLERYLVVLATVINIAPMLGFLGTVSGMIGSFTVISESGMDPQKMAGGISEALITTASGLVIAIPCQIAYNYFTNRVQRFVLDIEESAAHFIEVLAGDFERIEKQVDKLHEASEAEEEYDEETADEETEEEEALAST
jgi:biopolymer transport protein ExbB